MQDAEQDATRARGRAGEHDGGWRKAAVAGGVTVGALAAGAAVANAAVAARGVPPLENPVGGAEGSWSWQHAGGTHRIAWTRRGRGSHVLLVHAIHAAAWSYEWRHVVDRLAERHTVWTLDLLGFGRSDRPDVRYTSALYVALLDAFTREVIDAPCALVGSSLSAAYTVALAARDARRFPALVVVTPCGITHLASTPGPGNDVAQRLIASPLVGTAFFNALVSTPSLKFFLDKAYATPGWATPELVAAHWRTAHQPGARFAPAAFVGFALNLNVRDAARRLEQPVLVTWGDRAKEVPRTELEAYQTEIPHAEVVRFADSASLPHDERAERWAATVLDFLARAAATRTRRDEEPERRAAVA